MIPVMIENEDFAGVVRAQARAYPDLQAQDLVKLAYQHARGCEHMVRLSPEIAEFLAAERQGRGVRFENIGNGLVRAYLTGGENELSTGLLARMFVYSARYFRGTEGGLEAALQTLQALAERGEIPVPAREMAAFLADYRAAGCPAVHHSEAYRASYAPRYRVLLRLFRDFIAAFRALEELKARKKGAIVAIDGMCASGKTTLARALAETLDANVYHMDDFFLPPALRTKERLDEVGGNVDRERFLQEVLIPLAQGRPFAYRPFRCDRMALAEAVESRPGALNIVEGAYSCHPALREYYDAVICLTIDPQEQARRIRARNGEGMLARFVNEWIPMENRYLAALDLAARADLAFHIGRAPA